MPDYDQNLKHNKISELLVYNFTQITFTLRFHSCRKRHRIPAYRVRKLMNTFYLFLIWGFVSLNVGQN